jgi:Cellulase (glycosyl hydrolase family 5)
MTTSVGRSIIAAVALAAAVMLTAVVPSGHALLDGRVTSHRWPPPQEGRTEGPIALDAGNPHYFHWRGRPTILLTSAEHYGAVINLDFDYRRYLDTLAGDGMNYTRVFSGAYVEPQGAFKIARNTLAPGPGRFIAPWARSAETGYANGGNTFDLTRWDEAYFSRLKDFIAYADAKGVVVELTLFCPMYEDLQWKLSPMNAANNVNGLGNVARTDVYTMDRHGGLLAVHAALTRKLVTELNQFDNLFFEICNEPYFGGVTLAWQRHIAEVIAETERGLPKRHLIAQNIANKSARIQDPHPAVSIFNFHYATPPEAVALNYALDKVIGDDETGFRGTSDAPYRTEAWEFIIAGGGLFNHLDYSFAVGHENGTFEYPASQPGGGNAGFRKQMKVLRDFINGFDFARMRPDPSVIKGGVPAGGAARALVERDRAMAIYVRRSIEPGPSLPGKSDGPTALQIELAAGDWQAEWVDTLSGAVVRAVRVEGGGARVLEAPDYKTDIALRLTRNSTPSTPSTPSTQPTQSTPTTPR